MAVSVEARLKELVILEQKHAENMNKLRERVHKLEMEMDELRKNGGLPNSKSQYLMSIDESLKFIKSYMSIELYSPYNWNYKTKDRLHINPYFKK